MEKKKEQQAYLSTPAVTIAYTNMQINSRNFTKPIQ
jgi:hypothetical protein